MRRAVFVVAAIITVALPAAAFAESPVKAPPAVVAADAATQTALVSAADALSATVSGLAGYAGIALDGAGLVLRWKGTVPATVSLAARRSAVAVRLAPAPYSLAELET